MIKTKIMPALVDALGEYISLLETFEDQEAHGRNLEKLRELQHHAYEHMWQESDFLNPSVFYDNIADFVVEIVQSNAGDLSNGLNYCVYFESIEYTFDLNLTESVVQGLMETLQCREEVADVQIDAHEGERYFDIVLYTSYAPNYVPEEEEE